MPPHAKAPQPLPPRRGRLTRWALVLGVAGLLLHVVPRIAWLKGAPFSDEAGRDEVPPGPRAAAPRSTGGERAALRAPARLRLGPTAWVPTTGHLLAALGRPGPSPRPRRRPARLLSFAVISDLHEALRCGVALGATLEPAVRLINRLRPDFVVGLGDLVAGGGDCKSWGAPDEDLAAQLATLDRQLLRRLRVPFVPVSGNHDLSPLGSEDPRASWRTWRRFWRGHARPLLQQARPGRTRRSFRFRYAGVGIVLVGDYGTDGLSRAELSWLGRTLRRGDLVFRHAAPWGISCLNAAHCGIAIRSDGDSPPTALSHLLAERRVGALLSGHTHAYYDGVCGAVRFVNTGSLGSRSMEYVRGWRDSPYARRQAFVWVDVYTDRSLDATFLVWAPDRRRFEVLDSRRLPAVIQTEAVTRRGHTEGVAAQCFTRNRPSPAAARLRRRIEALRP